MSKYVMPVTVPCETLMRAQKFYDNGMAFLEMGENYSALVNLALAANSLTELRSLSQYIQLPKHCMNKNPQFCETQQEAMCDLDTAIDKILRKVHILKKRVVEIRSLHGQNQSETSGDIDCKQTKNVQMQWTSKHCNLHCFAQIVGAKQAKKDILNGFVNPIMYPNMYGKVSKGILFYGMPGTGKTLLAKATAMELERHSKGSLKVVLLTPKGSDLKGKYFGETEQKIADLFECASKLACNQEHQLNAQSRVLAIIFIDEFEAIGPDRENDQSGIQSSTVNALLQAMDGVKSYPNVTVMAATNFPWKLDSAVLRRFETNILVDLPTVGDIEKLLNIHISKLVSDIKPYKDVIRLCPSNQDESGIHEPCTNEDWESCNNVNEGSYAWLKMRKYFRLLSESQIAVTAKKMHDEHFSGSDVDRYFKQVIRTSAEQAMNNGFFITGPVCKAFKDDRALISTLGVSVQPWASISSIEDDLPEDFKIIPSPMKSAQGFSNVQLDDNIFYNMYDPDMKIVYMPWQSDYRIRSVLLQVSDQSLEQLKDPKESKVLFHVAAPVRQGKSNGNRTHETLGLSEEFIYNNDQFQIETALKRLNGNNANKGNDGNNANKGIHDIYVPTKKDDMHSFIEVSIADLQQLTKPNPTRWQSLKNLMTFNWSSETDKQTRQNLAETMSSLLFKILASDNYKMYLLIGTKVYTPSNMKSYQYEFRNKVTKPDTDFAGQEILVSTNWNDLDNILENDTELNTPMYRLENHPFNPWNNAVHFEQVNPTNVAISSPKDKNDEPTITQDIRFVNWNITDEILESTLLKTTSTFNKDKNDQIQSYAKDPVAFMQSYKKEP